MRCPGCSAEMIVLPLDARLGTALEVDLCQTCRLIWFDRYEDLQLAPAATLKVFGIIAEQKGASRPPAAPLACPRCSLRLRQTHDMQRNTRFQYWRCETHGRVMTFIDFLRAKDFVRPLTPQQIAELRSSMEAVNCSNCGASIDLARTSICGHCGSALSLLDVRHMARAIEQLQASAARQPDPAALLPLTTVSGTGDSPDGDAFDSLIEAFRAQRGGGPISLIETGFSLLGDLLRKAAR